MKKLVALILALVMMMTMSTTAFAAATADSKTGMDVTKTATIEVEGVYKEYVNAATVVSVDVAWEAMSFTYANTRQGDWNTTKHDYDEDDTVAGWDKTGKKITVKNHSNTDVEFTFAFEKDSNRTENFDVTFNGANSTTVELKTADNEAYRKADSEGNYPAPTSEVAVKVTGDKVDTSTAVALGTITVTVAQKSAD